MIKRIKEGPEEIKLANIGDNPENWVLLCFADASFKSLPDKVSSVGGITVFMVNRQTMKSHLLEWQSSKLNRVCTSPSSAESLTLNTALGRIALMKNYLQQIMGPESLKISTILATDSKNSIDTAYSSYTIGDGWNAIDVAAIREVVSKEIVDKIVKVSSDDQLANTLTKNKPSSVSKLLEVLRKGSVESIKITF